MWPWTWRTLKRSGAFLTLGDQGCARVTAKDLKAGGVTIDWLVALDVSTNGKKADEPQFGFENDHSD